jgi:uncharacterized membrane protein YhhN
MLIWLPIPFLLITLILLLRAEIRVPLDRRQVKIWKPLSTTLVILVCALSFTRDCGEYDTTYTLLILVGLLFSMAGDVLLIFQSSRAFLGGLVAFLLAHVVYIAAFIYLQSSLELGLNLAGEIVTALALALVGWAVYRYFSVNGLGAMRGPVIVYLIVISVMVHRAIGVALVYAGGAAQPALMVLGALLFYLSDAILAINRFRYGGYVPWGRISNLSTYYAGQLLIALSASFFV